MDNIVVRILTKMFDLILLNILFVLCSVPIVTIGASLTAMYTVLMKMTENEEGYIARGFWNAFHRNLRQSTVVWLILLLVGAAFLADCFFIFRTEGVIRVIGTVLLAAFGILYAMEVLFIFPLIAKFENATKQMFKNAILIPISRLPAAFMALVITALCIALTFLNQTTILYGAAVWVTIGASLLGYALSFLFQYIFKRYV